jgi:low affinity Fe/Cu permease
VAHSVDDAFDALAGGAGRATGHWGAFTGALVIVVAWTIGAFFKGFTDTTWQLFINTGTTIITFLMVFLIQHTADKDMLALHVKLDRVLEGLDIHTEDVEGIEEEPESHIRKQREER